MEIYSYWSAVARQDAEAMRAFFHESAYINWHNTNEHFTVDEFIRVNCEYPGAWVGEVERIEESGDHTITVAHVFSADKCMSFHVVSFIRIADDKIISIDEYWGDDGRAPERRSEMKLGTAIER